MKALVATILVLVSSLISLAGTRNPSVPDEKYIKYGEDFHYVLHICGVSKDNSLFCGSSVVINPRWILTAAHVVKDSKHCGVHTKNGVVIVSKSFIHEDYDNKFGVGDIALCSLKQDIELDFYPDLYDKDDEVGKVCCISGYGISGTFITGEEKSDGQRRAGSNKIDQVIHDLLICTPSKSQRDGLTALEFLISSGDSGGGLFIDGKLAGINSCVMAVSRSPSSKYGEESGHTRISKFIPWIKKIIASESTEE